MLQSQLFFYFEKSQLFSAELGLHLNYIETGFFTF